MRNPDMVYVLKMEYVSKINIFGLNMMVQSGLEKNIEVWMSGVLCVKAIGRY